MDYHTQKVLASMRVGVEEKVKTFHNDDKDVLDEWRDSRDHDSRLENSALKNFQ